MNDRLHTSKTILIVDDHVLFRDGLVNLFQNESDYCVVDQASTVKDAVEKAIHHKPDIVLMDFSLPDGTGLDATKAILAELPESKIVFLTVYETDKNLLDAIHLGARGYLMKNVSGSSLLASIRSLDVGEVAMSRKIMSRVLEISQSTSINSAEDLIKKLSQREKEILVEIKSGASNLEIARTLFISENTVKHHVHSILEKLDVDNRRQAADIVAHIDVRVNKSTD